TKFARIPAVSIRKSTGDAIVAYLNSHPDATARILLIPTTYTLAVSNSLITTHVGVRIRTTHTSRSDVRITLVSPMGTRSVLQAINADDSPGPVDWTYWSTQHFYESSVGDWRVEISDERATMLSGNRPATGAVTLVQLFVDGIPIVDSDHDGLDDDWEKDAFGNLASGPLDDPDGDGLVNAREQILRTDPRVSDVPFRLEWTEFEPGYWRFEWPSLDGRGYSLDSSTQLRPRFTPRATVPGAFPRSEYVLPVPTGPTEFFRIQRNP
ncbi:MAG: proprotein convertase P-domain-containing protein, partial [Verrucomicrobiae bacterium]|nr:proprotein convertase P-domain-containing protein [Verrucomicrobiae bacterium]